MSSLNSSLPCKVIYLLVQGIRTPTSLGVGEELFYLSHYGTSHITAKFYLKLDNQKAKYQNHVLSTLQGNEVPKLCLNLTSTFIERVQVCFDNMCFLKTIIEVLVQHVIQCSFHVKHYTSNFCLSLISGKALLLQMYSSSENNMACSAACPTLDAR